jgi:hypothetical protein
MKPARDKDVDRWLEYVDDILSADDDLVIPIYRKYIGTSVGVLLDETLDVMIRKFLDGNSKYKYMKNFYRKLLQSHPNTRIIFYMPRPVRFARENYYEVLAKIILSDLNVSVDGNSMHSSKLACTEKESCTSGSGHDSESPED